MRWKDLLWTVQPPPNTAAWLDWATGIVHINSTKAEFDTAKADVGVAGGQRPGAHPRGERLDRSLTHENVHFMQCVTTGYLYRWAFEYFRLLARGLTELGYPFPHANDVKAALVGAERRLGADTAERLSLHAAQLDAPGPHGLTTRHLFEAHALYVEHRMHFTAVDADVLLHLLDTASPGPDYRIAYDLARFWLGHGTGFHLFPALAVASLCTSAPPEAFLRLLRETARFDPPENVADFILEALNNVATDILIGSATEVWEHGRGEHPVYGPAVRQLNELAGTGRFHIREFMTDPGDVIERLVDDVVRPTLFRPSEDDVFALQVPAAIHKGGQEAEIEMQVLLLVSALSNRIHQVAHGVRSDMEPPVEQLSWLCEVDPRVKVLEIAADWLAHPEHEHLTSIMDPHRKPPEKRQQTVRAWGGCVLTFPIGDEDVAPRHSGVQRFVRRLHHQMPYFPLYINFTPELQMFFVWFGALAEEGAWHGTTTFDISHPSVLQQAAATVQAMQQVGKLLGFDVGPQVERMLALYPQEARQLLLALQNGM